MKTASFILSTAHLTIASLSNLKCDSPLKRIAMRSLIPATHVAALTSLPRVTSRAARKAALFLFSIALLMAGSAAGSAAVVQGDNVAPAPYAFITFAGMPHTNGKADGTGRAARFHGPCGVAVDSAGNVYVADFMSNTIRKITSGAVVSTLAGFADVRGSADGRGSAARFAGPTGLAVDRAGNLYVADYGNHTVRKITPRGMVSTLAGLAGGRGSADGTGSAARFDYPTGVAVDSVGNVYVADYGNHTIRKITPRGKVTTVAGSAGAWGSADGTGGAARFYYPEGVAVDSAGNVYVADSNNHTIRKINAGGMVSTVAGLAGTNGSADGAGSAARLNYPFALATDSAGDVYISDSNNHTIRKITSGGVLITLAGLAGTTGSADGAGSVARFNNPGGVAVSNSNTLYVADNFNNTIRAGQPAVLALVSASSRKTHGNAGTFDINLPLVGEPGVECRNSAGIHTLVFSFTNDVVSGNASVTSGTGLAGSPTFAANTMTVGLSGVMDMQKITVTLSNVTDIFAQVLPDTGVSMYLLIGDTNGDKIVDASDIALTKAQSGILVSAANFRKDVTVNSSINSSDVALVKANSGHSVASGGLPPDPVTVAPPLDPTVPTNIGTATEFLYTGANPIQTGVAPGTINKVRAAVLRGKVFRRDGTVLPAVRISVLGHPEFGQTLSRADGAFDLAVNGGGQLTMRYELNGFLPAQRAIVVPWRDYASLPDVIMIPFDPVVTTVDLNVAAMQVARGSAVSDVDGARQATVMVPAGTTAELVMPDGSRRALSTLHMRATEYTIGSSGPKAMPAPLPPSSGYTYAAELSADEAVAAGASSVAFSQPLFSYVENFIGFPVGEIVPAGYYDRAKAAWVASANGRVIRITAITGGLASVDSVGTRGLPPLVISDAEREQLALTYAVGQELWRVPITHFTPWDYNWARRAPVGAVEPMVSKPRADGSLDCSKQVKGSIIECENQVLGETTGIVGTPYTLNYRSIRVPGRTVARTLRISLSGAATLPASLKRITLDVEVAGRAFGQTFAVAPNQETTFLWDGLDAYGRTVQGRQLAKVRIGYVYGAVYVAAEDREAAFAGFGTGTTFTGNRDTNEITIIQSFQELLGFFDARAVGLGGWSLSAHHVYAPTSQELYLGDGSRRSAGDLNGKIITTVAQTPSPRWASPSRQTAAFISRRGVNFITRFNGWVRMGVSPPWREPPNSVVSAAMADLPRKPSWTGLTTSISGRTAAFTFSMLEIIGSVGWGWMGSSIPWRDPAVMVSVVTAAPHFRLSWVTPPSD